jgi:UDP-glucose:(heptosyl)LPS alpha-1,3-glucosyltransferase
MVRDEIRRWFGLPDERLVLIRNGVDLDRFRPATSALRELARSRFQLDPHAPVFVFVGSGFERKGLAVTLQALARVPSATLLVVGRDRHATRYQRMAAMLGVSGRAHFHGPQTDVLPYLHAADAFVLPSLYDPQPNAALEAMACGLPVITSAQCGAAELLVDGGGFVSDALDVSSVAAAMDTLCGTVVARGIGELARQAIEPYSLERMRTEYLALYRRLLPAARAAWHHRP